MPIRHGPLFSLLGATHAKASKKIFLYANFQCKKKLSCLQSQNNSQKGLARTKNLIEQSLKFRNFNFRTGFTIFMHNSTFLRLVLLESRVSIFLFINFYVAFYANIFQFPSYQHFCYVIYYIQEWAYGWVRS